MTGRPRVPTAVKIARGTYRPDRAVRAEAPSVGKPSCPSWLKDPDARREFRRVSRLLTETGVAGAQDSNLITRYVTVWVRWKRVCLALIANPGAEVATYKDEAGRVKSIQVSALHSIARGLGEELGRCESALGLTPSARSRIEAAPPAPVAEPEGKSRFFDPPLRLTGGGS